MSGIGEVAKKSIEVSVEIVELADWRERFADTIPPPSPLEAAQFVRSKSGAKGQPRRLAESTAKAGTDRLFRRVDAELPRESSIGATDRLARLEQSTSRVEECGLDQL